MTAYAGIFESEAPAKDAIAKLTEEIFTEDFVRLIGPVTGEASTEAIRSAHEDGFLSGIRTRVTKELGAGHVVLLVKAPIGSGMFTEEVLKEHGAVSVVAEEGRVWLHVSETFGLPMLATDWRRPDTLLTRGRTPLSSLFGMKMVIRTLGGRESALLPYLWGGQVLGGNVTKSRFVMGGNVTKSRFVMGGNVTKPNTFIMGFLPLLSGRRSQD